MATETNLTRVNVFPSEASYNTNKSGLGSGELSIVKVPQSFINGGVSSSNFGQESGYIKFENGLMLCYSQGKNKTSARRYTFPQAFAEIPAVVSNRQNFGVGSNGIQCITKTYFEIDTDSMVNTYIAIGLWQSPVTHTGYVVRFIPNSYQNHYRSAKDTSFDVLYIDESGNEQTATNPTYIYVQRDSSLKIYDTPFNRNQDMWVYKEGTWINVRSLEQRNGHSVWTWTFTISSDTYFGIQIEDMASNDGGDASDGNGGD